MLIAFHGGKDGEEVCYHAEQVAGVRQTASAKYPETQAFVTLLNHQWGGVFVRETPKQVRRKVNAALREKYRLQAGTATTESDE